MRGNFLSWLRMMVGVRGQASSALCRPATSNALSSAEERSLFFDTQALAKAKQRLGCDGRHWGRLLASCVLTCGLLTSSPLSASEQANSADSSSEATEQEESSAVELLLDLILELLGNGEGGGSDPGGGSGL
ncbi:hypothetical protein [Pseudomarimonas arenosa]|uniref:Uncharacterized protein n=1 Tax=Pseudomarimonas arenosa TaxID=2774145 RepID=A0AAW3ZJA2_9GAMM|nr:hypothetical protein [Pseudomarimonas arenosa]MBD8525863.1 hypothetical protein [Pseudomarimonas arenosa]